MKYLRRMMWSLALVAAVIFSNAFVQTIQASEVLSYTQTASLTKDNQAVTSGTTVLSNEKRRHAFSPEEAQAYKEERPERKSSRPKSRTRR